MADYSFSFIIPLYNKDNLMIQRCLDTIPKRDDVQIIIVDDHSPNYYDSNDTFKKDVIIRLPYYGHKNVEYYFLSVNGGPGVARNYGIDQAQGEWLIFCDADDFYFTANLNKVLDYALDADTEIIYWGYVKEMEDESYSYFFDVPVSNNIIYHISQNEIPCFITCMYPWVRMVRKSLIDKLQISFSPLYLSEDRLFNVKTLLASSKTSYYPVVVYRYNYLPTSLSHVQVKLRRILSAINISIEVNKLFKKHLLLGRVYDDTLWVYLSKLYKKSFILYWYYMFLVYITFGWDIFIHVRKNVCFIRNVHTSIVDQWKDKILSIS